MILMKLIAAIFLIVGAWVRVDWTVAVALTWLFFQTELSYVGLMTLLRQLKREKIIENLESE